MPIGISIALLMNFSAQASPPHTQARQAVAITTSDGTSLQCARSHVAQFIDPITYYVCGPASSPSIVANHDPQWSVITPSKTSGKPVYTHAKSVTSEGKTVYRQVEFKGMDFFSNNTQGLDGRYSNINAAITAINPWSQQFEHGRERPPSGSPEFVRAASEILPALTKEAQAIRTKFHELKKISLDLSNGATITCTRGATRPLQRHFARLKNFADPGCELFTCPQISANGKNFDVLVYQNTTPDSLNTAHITISNPQGFGPDIRILKAYAGQKTDGVLLHEAPEPIPPLDTGTDRELSLPGELAGSKTMFDLHLHPGWPANRKFWESRCQAPAIARLVRQEAAALERAQKILARTRTVQLISSVNGEFKSRLVVPGKLPSGVCNAGGGAYLTSEAAAKLTRLRELIAGPPLHPISLSDALKLFRHASAMKDIPHKYASDGCHARAHVIADRLARFGVPTEKIWMTGDLSPRGKQFAGRGINWRFHVASVVHVADGRGHIQKMVIDPTLANGPVSVEKWTSLIAFKGRGRLEHTAFPPPYNAHLYGRATLSFSAASVYLPDSLGGERNMTPKQAMAAALKENTGNLSTLTNNYTGGRR
ncbi:MAG: hypothetical protein A2583_08395 [Bdellovibrionales bacterium RIFOXYD1_FULL_53_11]|nr:MAG: hypothetical protein A2583_08395 [Bdellovibrionales bacterium RIFOXYD1_FULL_53_11]